MNNNPSNPTTIQSFLSGDKIFLRGLRHEDMESYRNWLDNPETTKFMESGWKPTSNKDIENLYHASTENSDTVAFAIIDQSTGQLIGCCGLYLIQWICRRAEFRIIIGEPSACNKGFGREVAELVISYGFNQLNLENIYLGVNCKNKGAIKSYQYAGFINEGIRRKLIYINGLYYDVLMMSILKEEYFATLNKQP